MAAFRGAVEVGAHALEADLHLSKDGVIVLSHDVTLKRCYGEPLKVAECDWDYLSKLRTLREPKQPLPRLLDLLEYLAQPEQAHIWLMVDIKTDDNPSEILPRLAALFTSVPSTQPWNERVILCPWDGDWVAACLRYLPGFALAVIAFSPAYASALLPAVPNLNFSLFNYSFATPSGSRFLPQARQGGRLIFSWTDNKEEWMALSIHNEVDGVITNDPKQFLELCDQWSSDEIRESASKHTWKELFVWMVLNVLVWIAETISRLRSGSPQSRVKKSLKV